MFRYLPQQRLGKLPRIEGLQVLHLLAHADEVHRNGFFLRNGGQHAALGGAVQFGDDQAR